MSEALLRLEGLSKFYTSPQGVTLGLNELSMSFRRGEFVAITGESGSGKSTLAHVLGGILPYESGELYVDGKPTSHFDSSDYQSYRAEYVSFIAQNYGILDGCSVLENVVSALRFAGLTGEEALPRAEEILSRVSLQDLRRRRAGKLSSGQKQRLSIARALAKPAPILIADEPTGNLDPENSRMVMQLLAQAAKERLVILITHDFSEAQGLATRHIALHNAQVVLDVPLAPSNTPEAPPAPRQTEQRLGGYVARLQLMGRPVWTALVLTVLSLTAFAVFTLLGTFLVNLDDTDTRLYDNSAFRNGDRLRIAVVRQDGEPMEDADYEAMLSLEQVQALEKWGYVTDINYAWRQGVDYDLKYDVLTEGDIFNSTTSLTQWVSLRESAPFLRTVPLLSADAAFLTAGRLPQGLYEAVASGSPELLGKTVTVYLQNRAGWSSAVKVPMTVEIVGVTDFGTGLYFHDDLGRAFSHCYTAYDWFFLYDESLPEDRVLVSKDHYKVLTRNGMSFVDLPDLSAGLNEDGEHTYLRLELADAEAGEEPCHGVDLRYHMLFSRENFYRLTAQSACDQVSLTLTDYAYTDEVLAQLQNKGYIAVSPFREGSARTDPKLAAERKQTLTLSAAALVAVLVLQLLVLRALFNAQTESFRLLAAIGMDSKTMSSALTRELLTLTLASEALGMSAVALCGMWQVERVTAILRYLTPVQLPCLCAVHLIAAVLGLLWIRKTVTRQIFPQSGRKNDLPGRQEVGV